MNVFCWSFICWNNDSILETSFELCVFVLNQLCRLDSGSWYIPIDLFLSIFLDLLRRWKSSTVYTICVYLSNETAWVLFCVYGLRCHNIPFDFYVITFHWTNDQVLKLKFIFENKLSNVLKKYMIIDLFLTFLVKRPGHATLILVDVAEEIKLNLTSKPSSFRIWWLL